MRIFGHRVNTHEEIVNALKSGVDGLEVDLQLSKDEELVLWHDRNMESLGLPSNRVREFTAKELQSMGIVTFYDYLDNYGDCHQFDIEHHFDLKFRSYESFDDLLLKCRLLVTELERRIPVLDLDNVYITSYSRLALDFVKLMSNDPITRYLDLDVNHGHPHLIEMAGYDVDGYSIDIRHITDKLVDYCNDKGKPIMVYTCNDPDEISLALDYDVDILITDNMEWLDNYSRLFNDIYKISYEDSLYG